MIKKFEELHGRRQRDQPLRADGRPASRRAGDVLGHRARRSTTASTTSLDVALVLLRRRVAVPARADRAARFARSATARPRRCRSGSACALQDARLRVSAVLRGRRRLAVRDRNDVRQPGHLPRSRCRSSCWSASSSAVSARSSALVVGAVFIQFLPLGRRRGHRVPTAGHRLGDEVAGRAGDRLRGRPDPAHVRRCRRASAGSFRRVAGRYESPATIASRLRASTKELLSPMTDEARRSGCLVRARRSSRRGRRAARPRAPCRPGCDAHSILLGGTSPLSGPASAYASVARGADAYFKYVNARGGVNGRKITYKYVDDAYNPAQTVQATRQLVEQDEVFADLQRARHRAQPRHPRLPERRRRCRSSSSPPARRPSAATTAQYPCTIGFQPSYQAEGWVYGKYLARTKPQREGRACSPRTTTTARTCWSG